MDIFIRKNIVSITAKIVFFVSTLFASTLFCGSMQESFLKAQTYYSQDDTVQALRMYQVIEPKGPAVFHNMGNCYYAQGNVGQAIIHWLKAQKNSTWHDQTLQDAYIKNAYQKLGVSHNDSFVQRLTAFAQRIIVFVPLIWWQLLFIVSWLLLSYIVLFSNFNKRRWMGAILLIITICTAGVCYMRYRDQRYPEAYVIQKSISLYAGLGKDYAIIKNAKELENMRIYEERLGWYKVYTSAGVFGWTERENLAII